MPQTQDWNKPYFDEPEITPEEAARLLTDGNAMREHVIRQSRMPFKEVLARLLQGEPTLDEVKALSRTNPEKWVKMIRDMGAMAGYKDGIEIDANINLNVEAMSDVELELQFQAVQAELNKLRAFNGTAEDDIEEAEFYEAPRLEDLNADATKQAVAASQADELPDFLK